jgi:hypothetical protein
VLAASIIAPIMKAAGTSKKSVNFYQITRRYIPEDIHPQNRVSLCEKLMCFN